jgi:hypothetical protein
MVKVEGNIGGRRIIHIGNSMRYQVDDGIFVDFLQKMLFGGTIESKLFRL